jgi:hypothetical protein
MMPDGFESRGAREHSDGAEGAGLIGLCRVKCYHVRKGAAIIERRIADLLAATPDRALDIAKSRSCVRSGWHRRRRARNASRRPVLRIVSCDAPEKPTSGLGRGSTRRTTGPGRRSATTPRGNQATLEADRDFIAGKRVHALAERVGLFFQFIRDDAKPDRIKIETDFWCTATLKGRLYFHPRDVPVRGCLIHP